MKKNLYLIAVLLPFLLAACSENETVSPFAPAGVNKISASSSQPYKEYQVFKEVLIKDWTQETKSDQVITITLAEYFAQYTQLYLEVIYVASPESNRKAERELISIDKPGQVFSVTLGSNRIQSLRVFAYEDLSLDVILPFEQNQRFYPVDVKAWDIQSRDLIIFAGNSRTTTNNFAVIETGKEALLVYLSINSKSEYKIPEIGISMVNDIRMYGMYNASSESSL